MNEWKLIRNANGQIAMVYYQVAQPEFNRAFGEESQFRWESRALTQDEMDEEIAQRRRAHYPDFHALLLAVYAKEKGITLPMNRLVARIDAIHQQQR